MQQYFGVSKKSNIINLNEKDFNHIKNVMRMKEGEEVFVVFEQIRYICYLNKDLISATIKEEIKTKTKNSELIFYIPFLQDEKMSFIFQKGTELGITKFIPVIFEHCKYKIDIEKQNKKINRWNKIIIEASEQTYRNDVPVLEKFINVPNIKSVKGMNILCSLDTTCVKNINDVLNHKKIYDKISVVFGPEGGITKKEEDIIVENGYERISLGKSVLRTETVPLFISSIIKYLEGSEQ